MEGHAVMGEMHALEGHALDERHVLEKRHALWVQHLLVCSCVRWMLCRHAVQVLRMVVQVQQQCECM